MLRQAQQDTTTTIAMKFMMHTRLIESTGYTDEVIPIPIGTVMPCNTDAGIKK